MGPWCNGAYPFTDSNLGSPIRIKWPKLDQDERVVILGGTAGARSNATARGSPDQLSDALKPTVRAEEGEGRMAKPMVTSMRHGKAGDELTTTRSKQRHSVTVEMDRERGGALVKG
jgi:hypothetical protein